MAKTRYLVRGIPLNPDPALGPNRTPGEELVLDLSEEDEARLVSRGALEVLGPVRAEKPPAPGKGKG